MPLCIFACDFEGVCRGAGTFEVRIVTPPPTSLGIHRFPPDTHNGDQIEVDGKVKHALWPFRSSSSAKYDRALLSVNNSSGITTWTLIPKSAIRTDVARRCDVRNQASWLSFSLRKVT